MANSEYNCPKYSKNKKIGCLASSYPSSRKLKDALVKRYDFIDCNLNKNYDLSNLDIMIVMGGDGFMLRTMHKFCNTNVKLYGINCGSMGFLLNAHNNKDDLLYNIDMAIDTKMKPISGKVSHELSSKVSTISAFNEIYIMRNAHQAIHLSINLNGISKTIIADGILISTIQGSSAYNASCNGPILPYGFDLLSITPINPFSPRGWRGAIVDKKNIDLSIEVINPNRREANLFADFMNINKIHKLHICKDTSASYTTVMFNKNKTFADKILEMQMS